MNKKIQELQAEIQRTLKFWANELEGK